MLMISVTISYAQCDWSKVTLDLFLLLAVAYIKVITRLLGPLLLTVGLKRIL